MQVECSARSLYSCWCCSSRYESPSQKDMMGAGSHSLSNGANSIVVGERRRSAAGENGKQPHTRNTIPGGTTNRGMKPQPSFHATTTTRIMNSPGITRVRPLGSCHGTSDISGLSRSVIKMKGAFSGSTTVAPAAPTNITTRT